MKVYGIIFGLFLCITSLQLCGEIIDCDKNPSKCPQGSYKNSGCRFCTYDTQTKTLHCQCDEIDDDGTVRARDTYKSGCTAYKNDVYGHLDCE